MERNFVQTLLRRGCLAWNFMITFRIIISQNIFGQLPLKYAQSYQKRSKGNFLQRFFHLCCQL